MTGSDNCESQLTNSILYPAEILKTTDSRRFSEILRVYKRSKTKNEKIKKYLKARLPIFNWIVDYNIEWGINDLIAGITLGLTIIPESIACALLAGLSPRYGLCSAFIGSFIYLFCGSIPKVIIGPTSLVALVSLQFTVGKPIEFAFLLTLLSGFVHIIMGCLQLGFIFDFISLPVIKAFSSATAILVIESQIKFLLGINYLSSGFIQSLQILFSRIDEANMGDLAMGVFAIIFLIAFGLIEKLSHYDKLNKILRNCCRYLSFSRNTMIVIITAMMTYIWLGKYDAVPFALSQNELAGLPNFTIPNLTINTPERFYNFWDILKILNIGIIVIPIIGILTNISIGKLSPKGIVDSNQELLTLGICNIFGSCLQSMPISGAFSRSAISEACGLKTPMANLYSGIIVLLALSFLSPYFNFIPKATLAAIVICSIYTLLDFQLPRKLWYKSKREFFIWLLCFVVCICFGVEIGLFVSILVTASHLLFMWAHPEIHVEIKELDSIQYVNVTPGSAIYFPAINGLREKIIKVCSRVNNCLPVVIDCIKMNGLDYTAAKGILKLSEDLSKINDEGRIFLILYRLGDQKLIETGENVYLCKNEECLRKCLTTHSI